MQEERGGGRGGMLMQTLFVVFRQRHTCSDFSKPHHSSHNRRPEAMSQSLLGRSRQNIGLSLYEQKKIQVVCHRPEFPWVPKSVGAQDLV